MPALSHTARLAGFAGLLLPFFAHAELVRDSQLDATLRNFYLHRDYRQEGAEQSRAGSWAQAMYLRFRSGFTEGDLGFGVDATSFHALKLDGGSGTSRDGSLPYDHDSLDPADQFGRGGATLKIRHAKSLLWIGLLEPQLPVAFQDDVRVLPQTFEGVLLESNDIDRLKLTTGQLWSMSTRASSNRDKLYLEGDSEAQGSDEMNFFGADYQWTERLKTSYWFSNLKDIYDQHYLSLEHRLSLADDTLLSTTLRYYQHDESGEALSGSIDNHSYGLKVSLQRSVHTFSASYQRMLGADAHPLLGGYTPQLTLVNWVTNGGFVNAGERSWQLRYDYSFAGLGLPGLAFMTRYTSGSDIVRGASSHESEYERDTDLKYTVQSGRLRDLSVQLRSSTVRTSFARDYDELRLITSYTFRF